jgi:hypothetical protein
VRDVHDAEVFHFGIRFALDIAPSSDLSLTSRTRVQLALEISKIRGNLKRNPSADRNETPDSHTMNPLERDSWYRWWATSRSPDGSHFRLKAVRNKANRRLTNDDFRIPK